MAHTHTELGSAFRSLTRHEEYYLPGGDLFLLVEHHVFRVHRYFFERESTYFKGKLATPASPGSIRPGTSESSAILLEDVRVREFARFLWVFYNPKYSLYNTSVADWTAILSLAHRWAFPEVKALAVRELEKQSMPDIGRVVVYQDNQVDPNLLIRCYAALCEREEPLTPAEGRLMGIDTALTIAQLREMARRSPIDCRSPTSANIRGNELYSLVRELFRIAEPTRDDDSLPQTPLGGPLRPGLTTTVSTRSSTARPPPAKPTAQTTTQEPTPQSQLSIQMATPPLQAQELEARSLDLKSTPPKPERPQVITNPALVKVSQHSETSRSPTPAPETPSTTEKKKKKRAPKNEKPTKMALAPETDLANPNLGETYPSAAEEATLQQLQQQLQDGEEKKDGQVSLVDSGKTDEAVVGAPGAVQSTDREEKEKDKADVVTGGDGVSTDIPNTATDPVQEVKLDSLAQSSLTTQGSPLSPNKNRNDKHDYLKSPEERVSHGGLMNSIWNRT